MRFRPLSYLQMAALAYALIFSYNLTEAWRFAPLERGSWIPMLIWCVPVFAYRLSLVDPGPTTRSSYALLLIGIIGTFIGIIGSVNTIKNIGLACTLASFIPFSTATVFWLLASVAWMRPMGWLGSRYFTEYLLLLRILVVLIPTEWLMFSLNRRKL